MKKIVKWNEEKKVSEINWNDVDRNRIASTLRQVADGAPPIQASWLRELALAIDNQ